MDDRDGYLLIYLCIKQHYGFILLNSSSSSLVESMSLGCGMVDVQNQQKIYLDTWNFF